MNKTIKTKWLKALRSGDYQQTTGRLCRTNAHDSYCCLGVLIDIEYDGDWVLGESDERHPNDKSQPLQQWYNTNEGDDGDNYMSHCLNKPFIEHCELTNAQQDMLAQMNDTGKTFNQIADHIETNL